MAINDGNCGLRPVTYTQSPNEYTVNSTTTYIGAGDLCTLLTDGYIGRHANDANRGARGMGVALSYVPAPAAADRKILLLEDPSAVYEVRGDKIYEATMAGQYCRFIQTGTLGGGGQSTGYADTTNAKTLPGNAEFTNDEARLKIIGPSKRVDNDGYWFLVKLYAPTFGDTMDVTTTSK